ncbi:MAG: hypothetical protein ACYC7L_01020 [Nitrospirota bacterium]
MPVLHKYVDSERFYVLTSINNKIITFQLSLEGERRLRSNGIDPGSKFGRALLLDLYRSGDAFTHGSGPGTTPVVDPRQIQFDFENDPEPESLFPSCSLCSSIEDLHLVEIKDTDHRVSLLCPTCRTKTAASINASLPLPLVSRGVISRLLEMNRISVIDESVAAYRKVLDKEFSAKWETIAKGVTKQQLDLGISGGKQGSLL